MAYTINAGYLPVFGNFCLTKMSDSSSEEDFVLMENIFVRMRQKRQGIHPINRDRKVYGEYHHLFLSLKEHDERFFQYMRMTLDTFTYYLEKIKMRSTKTWCNWHKQPILPEERLVITIR